MVQINFAQKTINVKIVYYGPGMSGKTTNLEVVHQRAPETNRGDLTSISTDGDRTLFFDYMPLDLGTVAGMRTCFQCYTVPGQVYYNSTRKLVLQGVDGVIFIADSSPSMTEQNLESLRNLEENLNEYGKSLATMPHVVQFNKRDLPDAMDLQELNKLLNVHGAPSFEAVASTGQGVFPTLKALAASVLKSIMREAGGAKKAAAAAPAPTPAPAVPAARPQPTVAAPQPAVAARAASAEPRQPTPLQMSAGGADGAPPLDTVSTAPAPPAPLGSSTGCRMNSTPPPAPARPVHQPSKSAPSSPLAPPPRKKRPQTAAPLVSAPRSKGRGVLTGAFVLLAAAAGAAIAWVALKAL